MEIADPARGDALAVTNHTDAVEQTSADPQFADLLTEHWDRVYRFAYHLTGNAEQAEDLLQEAATEAFEAFDRFTPGTRFDRWLMRIMHNTFLDRVRRERRRPTFSLDDVSPARLRAPVADDPETALEASIDGPVRRALAGLPLDYRAVVVLVDLQGFSYEDSAQMLHIPVGTVRSRLHRGRLALREWLRPYVDAMKRGNV